MCQISSDLGLYPNVRIESNNAKSENGLFRRIYNFSLRAKNGLINISPDIDLNGLCDKRLSKNHIPCINHVEFQKNL